MFWADNLIKRYYIKKKDLIKILEQQKKTTVIEERANLARDLHDDFCQALSYINVQLQACIKFVIDKKGEKTISTLNQLVVANQRAYDHARGYILSMGTSEVENGLVEALRNYIRIVHIEYGLKVETKFSIYSNPPIEACKSIQLLRIVQEAFANIYKHAEATHVCFTMMEDNRCIRLIVRDNGKGFDLASSSFVAGFGIMTMHNRAEKIGGKFKIISAPGAGTKVVVEVLLKE
jgi:signal transduction histidine kinase